MSEDPDFKYIIRIANSDVSGEQRLGYALTSIRGIGSRISNAIIQKLNLDSEKLADKLTDKNIYQYPSLYLTGHGNIRLTENEEMSLRSILMNNGFLHADDNYGLDASFRRELKRVFPNKELVPLPKDHPIFYSYYRFPNGFFDWT